MHEVARAAMVLGDMLAAPLRHGSGVDDIACVGLPLVLLLAVLWSMWRGGAAPDVTGSDDPGPEGQCV